MALNELLRIFAASTQRKFRALYRNTTGFIFTLLQLGTFIIALFLFVPFYSAEHTQVTIGTKNALAYILLGASFVPVIGLSIWESAGEFVEEFGSRLIEVVMTSPVSKFAYIIANICSSGVVLGVSFLPIYLVAVAVAGFLTPGRLFLSLLLVTLTFINIMSFGAIITGLLIIFRRIAGLFGIIHTLLQFLTGILVPVILMPKWVQCLALCLPGTVGIDLVRYSVLESTTLFPYPQEIYFLLGQTAFFAAVSKAVISIGLRKGYTNGYL